MTQQWATYFGIHTDQYPRLYDLLYVNNIRIEWIVIQIKPQKAGIKICNGFHGLMRRGGLVLPLPTSVCIIMCNTPHFVQEAPK